MKKKILAFGTLLFTFAVFVSMLAIVLTALFPKKNNVFDELYYEVKKVRAGGESVLLTGTDTAEKQYDLGTFSMISIPDLHLSLSLEGDSLNLHFWPIADAPIWKYNSSVHFRYDVRDKKLYGERTLAFLEENFLIYYFRWRTAADQRNNFSLTDLGEYTFVLQESVSYNSY